MIKEKLMSELILIEELEKLYKEHEICETDCCLRDDLLSLIVKYKKEEN
jgi:hypothetical protein